MYFLSPLRVDQMLVHHRPRVTPGTKLTSAHLLHLGGERQCMSKVPCLRTQHNVPSKLSGVHQRGHCAPNTYTLYMYLMIASIYFFRCLIFFGVCLTCHR